jgi:hypothetical protein
MIEQRMFMYSVLNVTCMGQIIHNESTSLQQTNKNRGIKTMIHIHNASRQSTVSSSDIIQTQFTLDLTLRYETHLKKLKNRITFWWSSLTPPGVQRTACCVYFVQVWAHSEHANLVQLNNVANHGKSGILRSTSFITCKPLATLRKAAVDRLISKATENMTTLHICQHINSLDRHDTRRHSSWLHNIGPRMHTKTSNSTTLCWSYNKTNNHLTEHPLRKLPTASRAANTAFNVRFLRNSSIDCFKSPRGSAISCVW